MDTIKIKSSHVSQGAFVVINRADFSPEIHQIYSADPEPVQEEIRRRGRPRRDFDQDAAE